MAEIVCTDTKDECLESLMNPVTQKEDAYADVGATDATGPTDVQDVEKIEILENVDAVLNVNDNPNDKTADNLNAEGNPKGENIDISTVEDKPDGANVDISVAEENPIETREYINADILGAEENPNVEILECVNADISGAEENPNVEILECVNAEILVNEPNVEIQEGANVVVYDMSPHEVAERASNAAALARDAASSCRTKIGEAAVAAIAGRKRIIKAVRKSDGAAERRNATFYSRIAGIFEASSRLAAERAEEMRAAEIAADAAAEIAEQASNDLQEASDDINDKIDFAYKAADNANIRAVISYKAEYAALKVMMRCWAEIDDAEFTGVTVNLNRRSASTYGLFCDTGDDRCVVKVVAYISLLVGCAMFAWILGWKHTSESYWAILTVGCFLVAWPIVSFIYWFVMCLIERSDMAEREAARQVIRNIHTRITELDLYFHGNGIFNEHAREEV